jgi:PKD repeat protein
MNIRNSSIASLLAVVTIAGSGVLAQLGTGTEVLTVPVGGIFEMQSVGGQGKTSWVLTQNGEFIEANRDAVFRTRISQPGSFKLSAETSVNGETTKKTFTLSVLDRKPGYEEVTTNSNAIATYAPAMQNGAIALGRSTDVIKITPERKDIKVIAIDTDTSTDSNNDGNPENDDDTKNTLFRSEGNSLYLWIANSTIPGMRLGVLFTNNETQFENISFRRGGNPTPSNNEYGEDVELEEAPDGMRIQVLKSDNGEVQFGLQMDSEVKSNVLLLWNFGDGQQSMLDKPIHVFADSGNYDISVEVRNLKTGQVQTTVSDSIVINRMKEETETGPEVVDPKKPEKEKSDGGSILGLIFKLILILLISAAVGAAGIFIFSKVKKKGFSLEKSLEKAEGAIVKTPKETVAESAPPMEIHTEPTVVAPVETPVAAPEPEVVPPAPVVEAEIVPPAPEPTAAPEWLAPKEEPVQEPAAPEVVTPTPVAEPIPETVAEAPAPNVTHTAMEPAAEKLATDTTQAPDWLQGGIEKAEEVGQTVDAPPPEELQGDAPKEEPMATTNTTSDADREERQREKKRQKRQRYRENVKSRKENGSVTPEAPEAPTEAPAESVAPTPEIEDMDEPVAFIKAEDIAPLEANTPKPPVEEHPENPEKQGS